MWSPDSYEIAIGSTSPEIGLFIAEIDGDSNYLIYEERLSTLEAWLPVGRIICFVKNQDIFTLHADGSSLINLTNSVGYDGDPDWWWPGESIEELSTSSQSNFSQNNLPSETIPVVTTKVPTPVVSNSSIPAGTILYENNFEEFKTPVSPTSKMNLIY